MDQPASDAASDDLLTREGKSVQDFESAGIVTSVRKSLDLLPSGRRRLFLLASAIQVSLGLLDLLGIALVGLLATAAVSGTGLGRVPPAAQDFLDRVGLGGLTATQLAVLFAVSAVGVLIPLVVGGSEQLSP